MKKSLKNLDNSKIVRERNIKSCTELLAVAEELRTTVKWTLLTFVFSVNKKFFRELVSKTCKMDSAKDKLEASKFYRIDNVQHTLNTECVLNCHGP